MKKRKVFLQAEEARIKSAIQHIDRCETRLQKVVARCYDRERPTDQWSEEKKGDRPIFFSWLRKIFADGTDIECEFMKYKDTIFVCFKKLKHTIYALCLNTFDIIGVWPTYERMPRKYLEFHTNVLTAASLELLAGFCRHVNEPGRKKKFMEFLGDESVQFCGDMTEEQLALSFLICNICHVTELASSSVFVRDIVRRIKGHGLH